MALRSRRKIAMIDTDDRFRGIEMAHETLEKEKNRTLTF